MGKGRVGGGGPGRGRVRGVGPSGSEASGRRGVKRLPLLRPESWDGGGVQRQGTGVGWGGVSRGGGAEGA